MTTALELQNNLEQFLMIFEDSVRLMSGTRDPRTKDEIQLNYIPNEELQQRVNDMLEKHVQINQLIDQIPEEVNKIDDRIPEKPKLDRLFMERDKAIDQYNLIRRSLELQRSQLGQTIKELAMVQMLQIKK